MSCCIYTHPVNSKCTIWQEGYINQHTPCQSFSFSLFELNALGYRAFHIFYQTAIAVICGLWNDLFPLWKMYKRKEKYENCNHLNVYTVLYDKTTSGFVKQIESSNIYHQIYLILWNSFYFYNLCNWFWNWMIDRYKHWIMQNYKINEQVCIYSLADQNVGHSSFSTNLVDFYCILKVK